MDFSNPNGLYLLGFFMPLIILYLIKAKPVTLMVPSLLFFVHERKIKKYNSLFQKLLVRLLLFMQLFFLVLIALAASDPILMLPKDAFSLHTIAIVDMSASMNVRDSAVGRMESGREELLSYIKGKVSVILAGQTPVILASNVSAGRARALLTELEPYDTATRLDSAMLQANDLLGRERATVVIYSDFLLEKDDDILAAKKLLEAGGKRVVFVKTGKSQENLGFVSLSILPGSAEALVKNFGSQAKAVDISFKGSVGEQTKRIEILPSSTERILFPLTEGETTVQLLQQDRFAADDSLFIMNPESSKVSILLITNKEGSDPLRNALEANPSFSVTAAIPPVIPELNHDIVFIREIHKENLLPNTFREIRNYADKGGIVVLTAFPDLPNVNVNDLTALFFPSVIRSETDICIDELSGFTRHIESPRCFTRAGIFIPALDKGNASVTIASAGQSGPVMLLDGNLFYYGILESGFSDQIAFPLFWDSAVNTLLDREGIQNYNYRTGEFFLGENSSERIFLGNVGWAQTPKGKVGVNLLDEAESDLSKESALVENQGIEETLSKVNLDVNIGIYLLILAAILFFYELYYIKRRGDL